MIARSETSASWSERRRIDVLLGDIHVHTEASFSIGGGPPIDASSVPVAVSPSPSVAPAVRAPALRDAMAAAVYAAAYARLYRGSGFEPASFLRSVAADAGLVARLEACNASRAGWDPGWRVFARDADGTVHATKGTNAARMLPGRYAMPGLPRMPMVGDVVERCRERSSLVYQAGFYHAFGEASPNDYDQARITRLYWDVSPEAVEWLLGTLSVLLNRFEIPFWFKCPTGPAGFDRLDAAVLYLARRHAPTVLALLRPLAREFEQRLRGGNPLWTCPVFPGVGAADDPGTGESFGQSRCLLLASAVVEAWSEGRTDPAAREAAFASRLRDAGLDPARLHLAAGLRDIYAEHAEPTPEHNR